MLILYDNDRHQTISILRKIMAMYSYIEIGAPAKGELFLKCLGRTKYLM